MTLPDRILDLSNAAWPTWVQIVVSVAVLAVLVAVVVLVVRGVVWLFFSDWMRAIGTSVVLGVLVQTGVVSLDSTWGWVQGEWAADNAWVTLATVGLVAWPVWLVARHLTTAWSAPLHRLGQPFPSRH